MEKKLKKYVMREAHILGFFMGAFLSRWTWVALVYLVFVFALYSWSVWETCVKEPTIRKVQYQMTHNEIQAMPNWSMSMIIGMLEDHGFDMSKEISWYDDPVNHVRVFSQEIVE